MPGAITPLKKAHIAHIVRAAAAITGETSFVLVGSGSLIAAARNLPLDLMMTPELDIQAQPGPEGERTADLIDGSIGEGSQFHATFGYYAHGLPDGTAMLPEGWQSRAKRTSLSEAEGVTCICPDADDLALSKVCAWREKDRAWLRSAFAAGLLDLATMMARVPGYSAQTSPAQADILERLAQFTL